MSQEQNAAEKITKVTSEQVAEFLRINPEFFETNLDLVGEIQIPHISGEGTTSLIEHQVKVLRDHNEVLKDQLKTFAVLASENEELWIHFKDLAVVLLKQDKPDQESLISTIEDWLNHQYNLSGVTIKIDEPAILLDSYKADDVLKQIIEEAHIRCDSRFSVELLTTVFGKSAEKVKSCALIPLKNSQEKCMGLIALGSENTERFSAQQSTSYLDCLSQLLSQALSSA